LGEDAISLVPDLNLIAIRIVHVSKRKTRSELTAPSNFAARTLNFPNRRIDVARINETKAKMAEAADFSAFAESFSKAITS